MRMVLEYNYSFGDYCRRYEILPGSISYAAAGGHIIYQNQIIGHCPVGK